MEATKRPTVVRNAIKVKALLYLELKQQLNRPYATAGEIARVIGSSARSLYVLLERWTRWNLVIRYDGSPFSYSIDQEGTRYLSKVSNWFFSGYYSRKRKCRIPGYRGNTLKLQLELAAAANLVFLNYDVKRGELFYFKAPYHSGRDFVREPIIDNKRKKWGEEYLLLSAHETLLDTYNAMTAIFGEEWCKPAGQAMIDANLGLYWKKNEQ